jgi:hypothetical protein
MLKENSGMKVFCQFSEKWGFPSRLYRNWDTDCTLDQHRIIIQYSDLRFKRKKKKKKNKLGLSWAKLSSS